MAYQVVVQNLVDDQDLPEEKTLLHWAECALKSQLDAAEICLRLVSLTEMHSLNHHYRHKNRPTNVLAFATDLPAEWYQETPILGDIVICPEVVRAEATDQGKTFQAHFAHLFLHGLLHLMGYDHQQEAAAAVMEAKEIALLDALGFPNPYHAGDATHAS